MIKLLRQVDDNWYEGENNNEIGILPVSYVEVSTINQPISRQCSYFIPPENTRKPLARNRLI